MSLKFMLNKLNIDFIDIVTNFRDRQVTRFLAAQATRTAGQIISRSNANCYSPNRPTPSASRFDPVPSWPVQL